MSNKVSRRGLVTAGLGAAGLGFAGVLAERYGLIPPDHGGVYGVGETLTYAAQRLLMSHHSLAREFKRDQISKVVPVNGDPPRNGIYQRLHARGFEDWRLTRLVKCRWKIEQDYHQLKEELGLDHYWRSHISSETRALIVSVVAVSFFVCSTSLSML